MIHCQFVSPGENQGIIEKFQLSLETETEDVSKGNDHRQSVSQRHGAVLGLCSVVTAFPHTVPASVPPLLVYLGKFLHDIELPAEWFQTEDRFAKWVTMFVILKDVVDQALKGYCRATQGHDHQNCRLGQRTSTRMLHAVVSQILLNSMA